MRSGDRDARRRVHAAIASRTLLSTGCFPYFGGVLRPPRKERHKGNGPGRPHSVGTGVSGSMATALPTPSFPLAGEARGDWRAAESGGQQYGAQPAVPAPRAARSRPGLGTGERASCPPPPSPDPSSGAQGQGRSAGQQSAGRRPLARANANAKGSCLCPSHTGLERLESGSMEGE